MPDLDVLVIGGGVSGLAAASRLVDHRLDVLVLEASDVVGGKLRGHLVDGLQLDAGAESLLARRPEGLELVKQAKRGDDVVHPATSGARLWTDRLLPLPRNQLLGIPTDIDDRDLANLLDPAALEVLHDEPPFVVTSADESVGSLVRRQLGGAVVDVLVEPLLGGVYAGRADDISTNMALPGLLDVAGRTGTLVGGARSLREASAAAPSEHVFASVRGGLGTLGDSLVQARSLNVKCGTRVTSVVRHGNEWRALTDQGESITAASVVLAVPAFEAAPLLRACADEAAELAGSIHYASVALVTTVFDRGVASHLPDGTGFLVPPVTGRLVKAATFVSQKWHWVRDSAPDREVLRFSVGRDGDPRGLDLEDAQLTQAVLDEVDQLLGVSADPRASAVTR
ncbi:MAG: protoporphyrinogen oxidase, partial [Actinomycetes bacterium]